MNYPPINKEEIQKNLASTSPVKNIVVLETTESTMNDARKLNDEITLVVAEEQRATHGRFNRAYFADNNGGGIYMTLSLAPHKRFEELPQYTILAAVAVRGAIEKLTGISTDIKWVNDIYLNEKKFCGILTEAISNPATQTLDRILIGIGLNFAIQQFPEEIQHKATSLFMKKTPNITRNELIAEIWNQFFKWEAKDFLAEYRKHSFVLGKLVSFEQAGKVLSGVAEDITETGELVVNVAGELHTLYSGEISLKSIENKKLR
ncbi:BirA family transcriptional regulator, biotin operon repressor / biotin-[acetyl-CoA-carboxylase] ligase [Pilibacter termitis]|uniref:biotin--[biotin carboxyl-carrier protein] ligase n=1 Tax=Pilibacter termitis TaxID=263852 RepID=A0A1T4LJJ0_9ENTE|nr:biotin--[acetyl-CoA-carboxylase] ligase [Pilibacter termitis]SJZ54604.1 BirA family transcriptional regulator, biotin operon repressor / biotin-[acetyl-CoA-carboxylase] ligase [Pilibacter termitis]